MTITEDENNSEERLRNSAQRQTSSDRALDERTITENRVLSDDERVEMFRMQHFQHVLPDIPKIPGWHVCWLSTTSQNDTIARRVALGYIPVTKADVPGWDYDSASLKTGEYTGLIGINEMVAYKIREDLYQKFMKVVHFDEPNKQDEKLISDIKAIQNQARNDKSYIDRGEGTEEIEEALKYNPSSKKVTFD